MVGLGEIKVIEYLLEELARTGSVGTWFDSDYMTMVVYGPGAPPAEVGEHLDEILDNLAAQDVLVKSNRKYLLNSVPRARALLAEWNGEEDWQTSASGPRLRLSALAEALV